KKQYLIGEIYIDANRVGGMQTAITGGQQLIQQMIQGAPFQAVAQQFSAAPTAVRGGDAGWVVEGTVAPALQQAFDNLDVGQLSNPIVVEGGVYIIYMRDKREGSTSNLVELSQIMVALPEAATDAEIEAAAQRLMAIRPQLTCQTMVARAASEPGLLGSNLGESDVLNLAPQFQPFARSAEVGEVSEPIRTPLGLHLVGVCGRRVGAADLPTYRDVESQLLRANLAMLGRRYMRDLRADALIEMK
ncbi:MAG: peptidylprolyl isomerase, partial [Brevundimonas sp.]